jgi:hypothetical protein
MWKCFSRCVCSFVIRRVLVITVYHLCCHEWLYLCCNIMAVKSPCSWGVFIHLLSADIISWFTSNILLVKWHCSVAYNITCCSFTVAVTTIAAVLANNVFSLGDVRWLCRPNDSCLFLIGPVRQTWPLDKHTAHSDTRCFPKCDWD